MLRNVQQQIQMQGSKYYSNSPILSKVFEKQDRLTRPIVVQQTNIPFHFQQKSMNEQQQKKLMQKRIYEHPQLYVSTHAKCQVCNKFIDIQQVDLHSKVHFDEAERIQRILNNDILQPQNFNSQPKIY